MNQIIRNVELANSLDGAEAAREYTDILKSIGFSVSITWDPVKGFVAVGEGSALAVRMVNELRIARPDGQIRSLVMEYERYCAM